MTLKEFLKRNTKKGAKLAGKTVIQTVFDPKTWLLAYMAFLATRYYNKIGAVLAQEAKINEMAAKALAAKVETQAGMDELCQTYGLTSNQVYEVKEALSSLSSTESVIVKTASDQKKDWRSWLPGAGALSDKGAKDGLGMTEGQARLVIDAHDSAEATMKGQSKVSTGKAPEGR